MTADATDTADGPRTSARRERTRERLLDAALALFAEHGVEATSIEAICDGAGFTRGAFYSNFEDKAALIDALSARFALSEPHREDPSAPAEEWLVDGGPATVGIIASVTRSFCEACDRTRITAEGTVRSCLFGDDETDLRGLLQGDADDAAIADRWRAAQWHKQAGHGRALPGFQRPIRSMGAIGG